MKDIEPTSAPPTWTIDRYDCHVVHGVHCWVWIAARPPYCDRGRWLAHIEVTDSRALQVDHQDRWPRYYFDLERAKAEVEAWLRVRKELPDG